MLMVQVVLVAMFSLWPVFALMGRDYDAAVTAGGFLGFMLGTTANAMAVMRTLVERFGAAPRAVPGRARWWARSSSISPTRW